MGSKVPEASNGSYRFSLSFPLDVFRRALQADLPITAKLEEAPKQLIFSFPKAFNYSPQKVKYRSPHSDIQKQHLLLFQMVSHIDKGRRRRGISQLQSVRMWWGGEEDERLLVYSRRFSIYVTYTQFPFPYLAHMCPVRMHLPVPPIPLLSLSKMKAHPAARPRKRLVVRERPP